MLTQANADVLARLLTIYDVADALPTAKRIAEFVVHALRMVPGVEACCICLGQLSAPVVDSSGRGEPRLRCLGCAVFSDTRDRDDYPCGQAGDENVRVVPIETSSRLHGYLLAGLSDGQQFAPYESVVLNLANYIAVILENRWQQARLTALLRSSEVKYRALYENMTDAVVTVGMDGRIVENNPALEDMLGYCPGELVGRPSSDIVHPNDSLDGAESMRRLLAGETGRHQGDVRLLRKDGRIVWAHMSLGLARDASCQPLYLLATMHDVTESKRAEERLRESETFLTRAAGIAGIGSFTWDIESNVLTISKHMYAIVGVPRSDKIYTMWAVIEEFVHPGDRERITCEMRAMAEAGRVWPHECRIVRPDGGVRILRGDGEGVRDENGHLVRLLLVYQDITEHRDAEDARRRSEDDYRRIVETANEGVLVVDADCRVNYVNRRMAEMLGYRDDEMLGRLFSDFIFEEELPDHRERMAKRAAGLNDKYERRLRRKDGGELWTFVSATPIRSQTGDFVGSFGMFVDTTKQKADEMALTTQSRQLQHAARLAMVGELTAGIAHEVNQPLCSIVNYAKAAQNLIAQPTPDLPRLRGVNDSIAKVAARAGEIVRHIWSFARKQEVKRSFVAIEDLVQEALTLVRSEAKAKKVSIVTSGPPPGIRVYVSPVQIQQVLVNLLHNAIEAFEGVPARPPQVSVETGLHGNEIKVTVLDNGPGLPMSQMGRLFTPFFTTKPEGLGMGLAISKTIVESFGGRIWAQPNPDGGVAFHFTLPRCKGESRDVNPTESIRR